MTRIIPSIWGDAVDDMAALYTTAFPHARVLGTSTYPTEGLLDFQRPYAGKTLSVDLEIAGTRINLINGGPITPNPSLSFVVSFQPALDREAREHLDTLWSLLGEGGTALMPLGEYPHSAHFGWLQDRFGVSWQMRLAERDAEPRPFVRPSLMFSDENADQTRAALHTYVDLFPDSRLGELVPWSDDADAGPVMYGEAKIAGSWLSAMDSPEPHGRTFDNAVSLIATCADQDEIDRYWTVLSQDRDAEQCGWCRDAFGVNWQIVPEDIGTLLQRPGAYGALMRMGRIVLADLLSAGD